MVYAYIQDVPIGEDLYRKVIDALGPEPLAGLLLHLCLREPDGKLSPMLATKWEYDESLTTMTMDLRTDVTFSDGEKNTGNRSRCCCASSNASATCSRRSWSDFAPANAA